MVFNATFNNISAISWWSVLLVEDEGKLATAPNYQYTLFEFEVIVFYPLQGQFF
jgi:hypothetical protein